MEKKNVYLQYGLIGGLVTVAINLALYFGNLSFATWAFPVTMLPLVVSVVLCCLNFSKANDANITYGSAVGQGFKTALLVTLITLVWSIAGTYIFPDIKERFLEEMTKKMAEKGATSDEAVEKGMNMMKNYYITFMAVGIVFYWLLVGIVTALIGAAIAKKKPQMPSVMNN